jgi:hypothetical protein
LAAAARASDQYGKWNNREKPANLQAFLVSIGQFGKMPAKLQLF